MLLIWWLCPFAILASAMPAGDSPRLEPRDSPVNAYDGDEYDVNSYDGNSYGGNSYGENSYDGNSNPDDGNSNSDDGNSNSDDGNSNSYDVNSYDTEDNDGTSLEDDTAAEYANLRSKLKAYQAEKARLKAEAKAKAKAKAKLSASASKVRPTAKPDANEGNEQDDSCNAEARPTLASFPKATPSINRVSSTSSISYTTLACHALGGFANDIDGITCVCTNGLTKTLSPASPCPTTLPDDWTVPSVTPTSTSSTSDIPFSYYNDVGALIHCESSTKQVFWFVGTKFTETYCAGSTSTDQYQQGLRKTTTLYPDSASVVQAGNWGYLSTGSAWNSTEAVSLLAARFYTVFDSLCPTDGSKFYNYTTGISTITSATLPGGAKGSVTTTTDLGTFGQCNGGTTVSISPWDVPSSGLDSNIDGTKNGKLAGAISDSAYPIEEREIFILLISSLAALAVVGTYHMGEVEHVFPHGSVRVKYPLYYAPGLLMLAVGQTLSVGLPLIRMTVQLMFENSDPLAEFFCELLKSVILMTVTLATDGLATAGLVSAEMARDVSTAVKVGKVIFSCGG